MITSRKENMPKATVIETIELPDRMWINTKDIQNNAICAIFLEKNPKSRSISERDMIEWNDFEAFWTPACNLRRAGTVQGLDTEISIKIVGKPGVPRPIIKKEKKIEDVACQNSSAMSSKQ